MTPRPDPQELAEKVRAGFPLSILQAARTDAAYVALDALVAECVRLREKLDEANRWRDNWHDEAVAAIKTATGYEQEKIAAEARVAELEAERDTLLESEAEWQRRGDRAIRAERERDALREYVEKLRADVEAMFDLPTGSHGWYEARKRLRTLLAPGGDGGE